MKIFRIYCVVTNTASTSPNMFGVHIIRLETRKDSFKMNAPHQKVRGKLTIANVMYDARY